MSEAEAEKSLLLYKIVIRKKWLDLIAFVYKRRDISFVTHHLPYKQIGQLMGRETVYCNLNSNIVEGVGCPHAHQFRSTSERSGAHMYHLFIDEIVEN